MEDVLLIAAVALRNAEGRFLLQLRPEGTDYSGYWEFPGGKVETGETPEAALVRELDEELGIIVDADDIAPCAFATRDMGERRFVMLLYLCNRWTGTPAPLHAAELRWLHHADMTSVPMPPLDIPLISRLESICLADRAPAVPPLPGSNR